MVKEEEILEKLREVYDLEIGMNIVDLGLIYDINVKNGKVYILMTFTTPFCPYAPILLREIEEKLKEIKDIEEVNIEVTFDPPWTPDRMKK